MTDRERLARARKALDNGLRDAAEAAIAQVLTDRDAEVAPGVQDQDGAPYRMTVERAHGVWSYSSSFPGARKLASACFRRYELVREELRGKTVDELRAICESLLLERAA